MREHLELNLRAPYDVVMARCAGLRARQERRVALRSGLKIASRLAAVASLVALVWAVAASGGVLDTAAVARVILALGLAGGALWMRDESRRGVTFDVRKLEMVESVLEVLAPELAAEPDIVFDLDAGFHGQQSPDRERSGKLEYEHYWLHIGATLINDTILHIGCHTLASRTKLEAGRERERVRDKLKIGLILPNQDLFGSERPTVEIEPPVDLALDEIDVQGSAVVFWFLTPEKTHTLPDPGSLPDRVHAQTVLAALEICRESVAGVRSFSQPAVHTPAEAGRARRKAKADEPDESRPYEDKYAEAVASAAESFTELVGQDAASVDHVLGTTDREVIAQRIADNAWEYEGRHAIINQLGLMKLPKTRDDYQRAIAPHIAALLAPLQNGAAIRRLSFVVGGVAHPASLHERVLPVATESGAWIGPSEGELVEIGAARRPLTRLPANFDPSRGATVAFDPNSGRIGLWMHAWGRSGGRTFFWKPGSDDWTEHRHEFRSEDEHGSVCFLFDHERDAFVHIGVTYTAVWSTDGACVVKPAGPVQLSLSTDRRVAVSDPGSAMTLVIDLEHLRVYRVSPEGWALAATIEALQPAHAESRAGWIRSASGHLVRCHQRTLSWDAYHSGDERLALELAPIFDG